MSLSWRRYHRLLILRPSKGVGCAGPNRVLGSSWFERRQGWGYLQAPSCRGDQARSHCQRLSLFGTAVFVEVAVEKHRKCGSHDGPELSLIRTCIRLCDLIFRPCTQQLVTLYPSTTSSLATSLLLWDWSSQMCRMALLLFPSVELRPSVAQASERREWLCHMTCWCRMMSEDLQHPKPVVLILRSQVGESCKMTLIRFIKISASWSIGAKAPSAGWRSDHCLRWFDRDNWILPGNFYHWWPWSSWGWLQHEGFHWVCWARQLWRWFPQLLGQGRGPWGSQEQACSGVGKWQVGNDGNHRYVFPGWVLHRFVQDSLTCCLVAELFLDYINFANNRMESCQIKYLHVEVSWTNLVSSCEWVSWCKYI